ncbi:MAG: Methyltransferase, partial [Acidimicrobiales bacterium]|nr:Methyltransferase [Acidimicrobiales bacterium]
MASISPVTDLHIETSGGGARQRKGRSTAERSRLPVQRAFRQPRLPYAPTNVVSADELESIHIASMRILEEVGMDFLDEEARDLLVKAGATVDAGTERVHFDREMVTELIKTAPAQFTFHSRNPEHDLVIGGDYTAFGSVASAPNVLDLDRGRRIGNHADYQNLLRLTQMLNSVHFISGYPVEPIDLHASIRHLDATLDALVLTDKPFHAYSLGRQRNIDCLEMVRIGRQIDDETLEREPSIFTIVNTSSPLRLDTPMIHGILEYSKRNQIVCITPFTLAGAMAPVTLAGALAQQ